MATDILLEQQSNAVIPPGMLIRDELAAREMSQRQLALAMNRPVNAINEIVLGRKAITAKTALGLERVLEIPAHIWVRLEADYRLALERQNLVAPSQQE